jgi:hypothetical protein
MKFTDPVGLAVGEVTVAMNVTDFPAGDGFREDTIAVPEVAICTTCVKGADTLVSEAASPLYFAVMIDLPAGRAARVIEATPAESGTLPSEVLPFSNMTFPVGVGPDELTVAVRVTGWPYMEGFKLDPGTVLVGYCWTTCFTGVELAGL